jgi:hypothetical protein
VDTKPTSCLMSEWSGSATPLGGIFAGGSMFYISRMVGYFLGVTMVKFRVPWVGVVMAGLLEKTMLVLFSKYSNCEAYSTSQTFVEHFVDEQLRASCTCFLAMRTDVTQVRVEGPT